jgi:hypothetical protein
MAVKFSNNFSTFLSGGITASDTTITLQSVSGLPTLGSGDYTYLTIDSDTVSPTLEIVKVTAVNTGTGEVTVTRAQDGTTASSFSSGAKVELRLTAILLNDVSDEASTTDWPDVLNKPDPTLTITGDITGSATFTDLASASLTATASADLLRVDGDGSDLQNVRAETIEVNVKNVSGGSLAKGTPVHQTGTSGAATFEVVAADASNASVMPAHFVLLETLANGAEGRGLLMGRISGVNTAGFAEGDTIYVAVGGGYTNVAPTGEGNLIQNLGTVTRVDATNGGGEVMGAGRSAATPNLNNGNIFIGNASNQAVTASLSTSVSNAGFATTSYVDTAVANLVDSAPAALDTLNELAAALGDDANFSTTVTNSIALKQDAATAVTTTTTFGGDVSGTYNAIVVADDSHNHIIGNVDGLQAALDAKQAASTALTTTTTFSGDVSGTYDAIVVADDSHDHIIGNVDGLQTALDAKQNAATAVTTTTTFGGDVSGTYDAIVIADDSHNHVISNVDGLQTALDAKQAASTALTTSTTFGGDVSGTYNAIVVADDSHNHVISNVDGLQTALDGKLGSTANAVSASKWATARTVSLTGAVTGSASVDGSANVSIATTHTADPTITLTGAVTGSGTMTNLGNVSIATTATADPTLTLAGDASGSATFTNLGNATLTVTVADDSHNHVISNVDGLQTALNGKQAAATQLGWIDQAGGNYGTIKVDDDRGTGWAGYSIQNSWVFMSNGTDSGIYNDIDNEWMIYFARNAATSLYYNGSRQAGTENGYFIADNQMRSPIYYDSNNTAYYADPSSSSYFNVVGAASRFYTGYDAGSANSMSCSNWFRSNGATGWYNATYGGGIYMADSSYVRTYGSKILLSDQSVRGPIFYDSNNTGYYFDGNSTGDSIRVAGNIVAYYSDERLKTKVGTIDSPVEKVKALSGFKYRANETAEKLGYSAEKVEVGVSAQEVEAVLPEVVRDAPIGQGYKTVQYERLVPLLIEAIKEQAGQIEALQAEVAKLKG